MGRGCPDIYEDDKLLLMRDEEGELVVFKPCDQVHPVPNPCVDEPEMLLTVTGTTGQVTWCGETWNLPTDSGVEKSVCPTEYVYATTATTASFPEFLTARVNIVSMLPRFINARTNSKPAPTKIKAITPVPTTTHPAPP